MQNSKAFRKEIAEKFANILEEKGLEWSRGWDFGKNNAPCNGKTGYRYHGINRLVLAMTAYERGYTSNRWATFNQVMDQNWKLEDAKGMGVKIEYCQPWNFDLKKALSWGEYMEYLRSGKLDETNEKPNIGLITKYFTVFNEAHIKGMPPLEKEELREIHADDIIRKISESMGVPIKNDGGDQAYYKPGEDCIHLLEPGYFHSDYDYNSTVLHELAHSTGASNRLNRDGISDTHDLEHYAKEELVAEITACFMGYHLKNEGETKDFHIQNHQAYVQSWIKSIREKPEALMTAVKEADKAADYMEYHAGLLKEEEYKRSENNAVELPKSVLQKEQAVINKMPEVKGALERKNVSELINRVAASKSLPHRKQNTYQKLERQVRR